MKIKKSDFLLNFMMFCLGAAFGRRIGDPYIKRHLAAKLADLMLVNLPHSCTSCQFMPIHVIRINLCHSYHLSLDFSVNSVKWGQDRGREGDVFLSLRKNLNFASCLVAKVIRYRLNNLSHHKIPVGRLSALVKNGRTFMHMRKSFGDERGRSNIHTYCTW
jgi:hypothetical protein